MESTLKQNNRARVKKLMLCKMHLTKVTYGVMYHNASKKKLREKISVNCHSAERLSLYGDSQNPV